MRGWDGGGEGRREAGGLGRGPDMRPIMLTAPCVMVLGVTLPLTNRDGVGPHWLPVSGVA